MNQTKSVEKLNEPVFNAQWLLNLLVYEIAVIYFFIPAGRFYFTFFEMRISTGYDAYKLFPVVFITWLIWRLRNKTKEWFHSKLVYPFSTLILISFLSALSSIAVYEAITESLELLCYLGFFLILLDIPWTSKRIVIVAAFFLFGNLYLLYVSAIQYIDIQDYSSLSRISGAFTHPNAFSSYCILGIILSAWLGGTTKEPHQKFWLWFVVIGLMIALLLTQSRSALLVLLIGISIFIWFSRPAWRIGAVIVVVAMFIGVVVYVPSTLQRFAFIQEELSDETSVNRLLIWNTYLSSELHRLDFFGSGLDPVIIHRLQDWIASNPNDIPLTEILGPHNAYLAWFLGTGFIGLLTLGWIFWETLKLAFYCEPYTKSVLLAGIVGFIVLGLFENVLLVSNIPIAWLTIMAISEHTHQNSRL
jgi:O-antigen ligase